MGDWWDDQRGWGSGRAGDGPFAPRKAYPWEKGDSGDVTKGLGGGGGGGGGNKKKGCWLLGLIAISTGVGIFLSSVAAVAYLTIYYG